jgi:hypothetical protein
VKKASASNVQKKIHRLTSRRALGGIYLLDAGEDEHLDTANDDNEADISLNALSGICTCETMALVVSVQD